MFFGMILMALPPKNGCRVSLGVWVNEAGAAVHPTGCRREKIKDSAGIVSDVVRWFAQSRHLGESGAVRRFALRM